MSHHIQKHYDADTKQATQGSRNPKLIKLEVSNLACKLCPKPIKDYQDLLEHAIETHDLDIDRKIADSFFTFNLSGDKMNCGDCGEAFHFIGSLLRHVHEFHNKTDQFPCEVCGALFVSRHRVSCHMDLVHTRTPISCHKCREVVSSKAELMKHCAKFHRKDRLMCPHCPQVFESSYLKKQHLAFIHDIKSLQFNCEECAKVFLSKARLLSHTQKIHLKQKRFSCDKCGFQSFERIELTKHLSVHSGIRPYHCDYCDKTFRLKKTLKNHIETHSNVRSYTCSECGKSFVQAATLYSHKRVHKK